MVDRHAPFQSDDVQTWSVWDAVALHAEHVVSSADRMEITDPTSSLMVKLGLYFKARADYRKTEPLYRRALAIDEKSYGPEHPNIARNLNNLALLLKDTNRLSEAEPLM